MHFAEYLHKLMEAYGVGYNDIAKIVGVRSTTVKNWATGKTIPSWRRQVEVRGIEKLLREKSLSIINKVVIV